MPTQLVVIATFPNEAASLIARAILDANDIPSMVASDGSSSMEPQLQFSQGVRLLVHEDDAADARDLLAAEGDEAEEGDELLSDES
jgi:flagellar biosynthesis/type III secretory pathway M-ring protein FliF/YscJ